MPSGKDGVTLIRFQFDKNPDGPHLIDHGPPKGPGSRAPQRMKILRRQSETHPVCRYAGNAAWEYFGRYWLRSITDGGPEAAERPKICGRFLRQIIRLDDVN